MEFEIEQLAYHAKEYDDSFESGYLAACKKRQEELDSLSERTISQIEGFERYHYQDKVEIQKLKEEYFLIRDHNKKLCDKAETFKALLLEAVNFVKFIEHSHDSLGQARMWLNKVSELGGL